MKKAVPSYRQLLLLSFLLLLSVCRMVRAKASATSTGEVAITGSGYVEKGKTIRLTADQPVRWKSSNTEIATVSKSGRVSGIRPGSVVIRAISRKDPTVRGQILIRVMKQTTASDGYVNILLVGNSYTQDEFGYVPALLKELLPDLKFRIGLLYAEAASLALHYEKLTDTSQTYAKYSEYTSKDTMWRHTKDVHLSDILKKYDWRLVTFQQNSQNQNSYSSIRPYIDALIEGYIKKLGRRPVFLYNFPHVRGARNKLIRPGTTTAAYRKYLSVVKKVMRQFPFDDFVPNATAIENARRTVLNAMGDGGNMTADTRHLQDGLPCLVANYCSFLKLLPYIGAEKVDLLQSRILPTDEWIAAQKIPGSNGPSVGVTEENRLLAVRCAMLAIEAPDSISVPER